MQTYDAKSYLEFLEGYISFLGEVAGAQEEKLEALLSHDVEVMEQSVAKQQATDLEMRQYEQRRVQAQKEAGFGELQMGAIIELLDGADKTRMRGCYDRIRQRVEQIRFLNDEAMRLVELDLRMIDQTLPLDQREYKGYTGTGQQSVTPAPKSAIFDSKI